MSSMMRPDWFTCMWPKWLSCKLAARLENRGMTVVFLIAGAANGDRARVCRVGAPDLASIRLACPEAVKFTYRPKNSYDHLLKQC